MRVCEKLHISTLYIPWVGDTSQYIRVEHVQTEDISDESNDESISTAANNEDNSAKQCKKSISFSDLEAIDSFSMGELSMIINHSYTIEARKKKKIVCSYNFSTVNIERFLCF